MNDLRQLAPNAKTGRFALLILPLLLAATLGQATGVSRANPERQHVGTRAPHATGTLNCVTGGDDVQHDASYTDTDCANHTSFDGTPLSLGISDGTPDYPWPEHGLKLVFFNRAQCLYSYRYGGWAAYDCDTLDPEAAQLSMVHFAAQCPDTLSGNDDDCGQWAWDHGGAYYHNEASICVANQALLYPIDCDGSNDNIPVAANACCSGLPTPVTAVVTGALGTYGLDYGCRLDASGSGPSVSHYYWKLASNTEFEYSDHFIFKSSMFPSYGGSITVRVRVTTSDGRTDYAVATASDTTCG